MSSRLLLLTATLAAGVMTAGAAMPAGKDPKVMQAGTATPPATRTQAADALESGIAGAVIGALVQQFGEHRVQIRIDRMNVEPVSVVDRDVTGQGRLQLGGEGDWLPFRFRAGYNTQAAVAVQPAITIGADSPGAVLAPGNPVSLLLAQHVQKALTIEFAQQQVRLALERVTAIDAGSRYQRIEATGVADFLAEGSARTSITALYDRKSGQLVQLAYELGTEANWQTDTAALVPGQALAGR